MNYIFDNERPIYIQLVEKLKLSIVRGEYPIGSRLPSVRELALIAKANPNTIQKALIKLEEEKLIYTERTNGKYVTEDKRIIEKLKKELAEEIVNKYIKDMEDLGIAKKDAIEYLKEE